MPFLEVDNTKINYVTGKDGIRKGKKNLLFIHGAGGNHKVWNMQPHYFESNYNFIAVELPGHGESSGNGEKDISSYTEWIRKIIENLSLRTCSIIGHSMGGAITLDFVLKYHQYLDSIVLVGTGARLRVSSDILDTVKDNFDNAVKLICKFAYSDRVSSDIIELGETEMRKTSPEVLYGDFFACNDFDVLEEIKKIKAPTLIISGSEDRLSFPKYAHFLHENIQGSKLVMIQDAGHMIMIEKPKEFNEEVETFISNLP